MSAPAARARSPALFLDFDGTLVDIAERPEAVVIDPELPGLLDQLRGRLGGALAIVTGRPITDIDGFFPGLGIDACGMHGLETRLGGRRSRPDDLPRLGPEVAELRKRLERFPGVLIEDKGIGVAVHWRMAPEAEDAACMAVEELATRLGPAYRMQAGKAVREIVPALAGKGNAIAAAMQVSPYSGRLPIFAGDDVTDEHGFEAVNRLGGITVKVGEGETLARHRLRSPADLRGRLDTWLAGAEPSPDWTGTYESNGAGTHSAKLDGNNP